MTQHQQQAGGTDEPPMDVEPAHVMKREKHHQREHHERLAQEAAEGRK
ncbi:hypothetical protein GJ699_02425 [Duganella sp. FT80W]|uniref:Uncharacterized protein n=1 Tax=Duganella guangzhouensis TaxID=2666084 RepID=A0A6I2KX92_9BURK|nr:hypothetical protein [Duganella guangzhouensis]MRW88836.1 hypothetical protein [Duganella guangzhouensis]